MSLADDADIAEWISEFNAALGLPRNLGEMGVTADMVPKLAAHCMTDACHFTNPKQPTVHEYADMFGEAIS